MGGRRLRGAVALLTTRGPLSFRGRVPSLSALFLGEQDLLRVAVLLSRCRWSARGRGPLRATASSASAPRAGPHPGGQEARGPPRAGATSSRLPTGLMLSRTACPYVLGARPRFVLDRRRTAHGARSPTPCARRCGAGTPRAADAAAVDPFGMCELVRVVHAPGPAGRRPPVACRCPAARRRAGRAAARAGPGPLASPARTTSRPASTATETSCGGCTGAPPRGAAS